MRIEKKHENVRIEFRECWRCGERNEPRARYCWRCGADLDMSAPEAIAKKKVEDAVLEIVSMLVEMPGMKEKMKAILDSME